MTEYEKAMLGDLLGIEDDSRMTAWEIDFVSDLEGKSDSGLTAKESVKLQEIWGERVRDGKDSS